MQRRHDVSTENSSKDGKYYTDTEIAVNRPGFTGDSIS
jgi:hypothetical protein